MNSYEKIIKTLDKAFGVYTKDSQYVCEIKTYYDEDEPDPKDRVLIQIFFNKDYLDLDVYDRVKLQTKFEQIIFDMTYHIFGHLVHINHTVKEDC